MDKSDTSAEETTTEETQETENTAVDVLNMSDDDFADFSFDDLPNEESSEESADTTEATSEDESTDDSDDTDANTEEGSTDDTSTDGETDDNDDSTDEDDDDDSDDATDDTDTSDSLDDTSSDKDDTDTESTETLNYEEEYKKVLEPFKANGKMLQVDNVKDLRKLAQMGANYNKKMKTLKPSLKIIKMLDNNGLLDENKISNLIDLDKKNPEAIKKLIKDSGMDPLDINVKDESEYQPNTYTVDDKEIALDEVLSDIQGTSTFKQTLDIVSNKWDAPSKEALVANPSIIKVINEHVEAGIYDKITEVVERERMLGRLTDLSDIQAYKQVGDLINSRGGFEETPAANTDTTNVNKQVSEVDKQKEAKRKARKKAASHTTSSKKTAEPKFNPLAMSDEDFEKQTLDKYM